MTRLWWIVHNLIAHPLLLTGAGWAAQEGIKSKAKIR